MSKMDIRGINAKHVDAMKAAVTEYVERAQTEIAKLQTIEAGTVGAFRGEQIEAALKEHLGAVKEGTENLISRMLMFVDILEDIKRAYNEKDAESKSYIAPHSQTARSEYQRYTPEYPAGSGIPAAPTPSNAGMPSYVPGGAPSDIPVS